MKLRILLAATIVCLFAVQGVHAQVVLVEAGHVLNQIVDSAVPLHPSQALLEVFGHDIESIGIDPSTGDLYIQLSSGGFTSATTDIYKVTPAGVVTPVALGTGFGINSRGTDLHFDLNTGLLLTQNQLPPPGTIATVAPGPVFGTWSGVPAGFTFNGTTFGMDFSVGAGGSDVPAGEVLFTADLGGSGMHSSPLGGPAVTHPPVPPGSGDDLFIQPDGDWVHVGDFTVGLTAYSPALPHPHVTAASPLDVQTMFTGAGLPFVFGTRATVCDATGESYISYSGSPGGTGIFRVNEPLTVATLVLTIGPFAEGLQDLTLGPSTSGGGQSVYFTVHDFGSGGEEVWEVTVPECPVIADLKPGSNPNCVNPSSKGVVSVAILSSPSFDATAVDPTTVDFGGASPLRCAIEDVDLDVDSDLVCKFKTQQVTWPSPGSDCGIVLLSGQTFGGASFQAETIACLAGELTCNAGTPTAIP